MEIHSSSLTYIPSRVKTKNKNEVQNESSLKKEEPINQQLIIKNNDLFKATDLDKISSDIKNQTKHPMSTRSSRALNAYIQENIQPLKNQRSELVSKIDIYA